MQAATIDADGTQFAYLDSGATGTTTYTTLVIVHGYLYHAQIFRKLLLIAQNHNLRIIALNRRDYVGSTSFSAAGLDAAKGDDKAHMSFFRTRGLEIARFLTWVVSEKKIPRMSEDGKEGGLALMGWSLGNVMTTAFLRCLRSYPPEIIEALEPYLKNFIIYEPDYTIFGYPDPEGGFHFFTDGTIPPHLLGAYLSTWITSYYKHPYYNSGDKLERVTSALRVHTPETDEIYRTCTHDTFTADELASCLDPEAVARSDQPLLGTTSRAFLYDQTQGALRLDFVSPMDGDDQTQEGQHLKAGALLADLKIHALYCDSSIWSSSWCVWELEKDYERWKAEGRATRFMSYHLIKGANHFLHWDDPTRFLQVIHDSIGEKSCEGFA